MPTIIHHRNTRIVTLATGESIADQCRPGDIALVWQSGGWWTHFIGDDGTIESYDAPADNYNQALWTAKAAAEFDAE